MAAKVAAAAKARRDLVVIARTDAAASEGLDGAVARARLYMEAGADAIFPEALDTAEMFRAFAARMPGVPLLANMTEFGRTPFFTATEFEQMGYAMVIWPVSSLRAANKAQEKLYAAIARDGGTHNFVDQMQTRAELYDTIKLHEYEALDHSIVQTILPQGMPQKEVNPASQETCLSGGSCLRPGELPRQHTRPRAGCPGGTVAISHASMLRNSRRVTSAFAPNFWD